MNLIQLAIKRPTAVVAAVLSIIVFGLVALNTIPIQLTPDVRKPVIDIRTNWPGAAPADVEREITNRLEEELTGIEGVEEITSRSRQGQSRIRLQFGVGQNLDRALLAVSNRLSGINELPSEADQPRIQTSGSEDIPIAYLTLRRAPGNERDMETYGEFVEDVIVDRLERVRGVSQVTYSGGSRRELRIIVFPDRMARYGLSVSEIVTALRNASASFSAGAVDEGKRRYVVRTEGEIKTVAQAQAVVVRTLHDPATGGIGRVTVGDIASVEFGYKEPSSYRRHMGEQTITLRVVRETGANVIETMKGIREAVKELSETLLPAEGLVLIQVYDETVYINSAIALVHQNIYIGGTLAVLVLLIFLRSARATLVVSLAIPVSVIGAFAAMAALGRSINVISLAGIAFAVGMVVDAAIVVLENIYRHRQQGKSVIDAAYIGAKQVWGAVLASALTTVAVFAPILMLELQVGQLFRDIAVAISVAVLLSLLVSITVIPALSRRLLGGNIKDDKARLRLPLIDDFAKWFVAAVMGFTRVITGNKALALSVVLLVCGTTALATYLFLPKLDFLPDGNRNFVFGHVQPPPGYNLETTAEVAKQIEDTVRPLWASVSGPQSEEGQPPKIRDFFFIARRDQTFIGASAVDPVRAGELVPILRQPIFKEPGTRGFVTQASLFSRGIGGARSIALDVSGPDLEANLDVARRADDLLRDVLPRSEGHQVRPRPGLEMGAPEIRVIPDQLRLADAGVTARELGLTVDTFNDGLRIAEITIGDKRVDLVLQGPEKNIRRTQGINNLPVVTPAGQIVPASSLANILVTAGPTEIRHLDRARTVTLQIRPGKGIPLETTIEKVQKDVIDVLNRQGLPAGVKIRLSGAADSLTRTWNALKYDILVAVLIVFLVMAVLFESFLYPFIIMLSVPLATAGGILGLAILNRFTYQPLDMLTMLGFIILVGTVVNNAILLVAYTLHNVRNEGMNPAEAIMSSTRTRIRPIFMSTLTTVFGMMPLVVFPGAGSELYRGLGSVIIGGLSLSALLTLLIIPPLLSLLVWKMQRSKTPPEAREIPAPAQ